MRVRALTAAAVCLSLMVGVAHARPWNDPQGRVTFDAPSGWTTSVSRGVNQSEMTYVITGTANNECHVAAIPNPTTANNSPASVRTSSGDAARFGNDVWTQSLNRFTSVFPNSSAQIQSTSVDTSQFWPILRAEVQSPERAVHAAMEFRPGMEIVIMCMTYSGADPTTVYDAFIRSIGHPNDATWQSTPDAGGLAPAPAPAATLAPAQ